jgi:hypothetical protein
VRGYALWVVLALLVVLAAGCSVGSSDSSPKLTPSVVNRYVLVQEAQGNLARVLAELGATDLGTRGLGSARPGTTAYRNAILAQQLGWDSVLTALNSFTRAQGEAFPAVTTAVQQTHLVATQWLNLLHALSLTAPASKRALQGMLGRVLHYEAVRRPLLNDAARELAKEGCNLGETYRQLANAKDVVAECAAVKQLTPPPST